MTQYLHMVFLCFVLLWFHCHILSIHVIYLPKFFRITSIELGQSYGILKYGGKTISCYLTMTKKNQPYAYFLGFAIYYSLLYSWYPMATDSMTG